MITNTEIVDDYLDHLTNVQCRRPQTVKTYTHILKHWLEELGDTHMMDVRPPQLEAWGTRVR